MAGLSELFAPAYIAGNAPSMQAASDWNANFWNMTNPKVEQTRMPVPFNTGNPAGMVDPEALRVLAQGGPYDMDARRNAIAAQMTANNAAQPAAAQSQPFGGGGFSGFSGFSGSGGPYSGGGPVAPGLLPPQVNLGVS
jgi:uncharacterized membrane protein YgcG